MPNGDTHVIIVVPWKEVQKSVAANNSQFLLGTKVDLYKPMITARYNSSLGKK